MGVRSVNFTVLTPSAVSGYSQMKDILEHANVRCNFVNTRSQMN